jgi:hypothetical protein
VKNLGLDGSGPADGPNSAGANSGQTEVVDTHLQDSWTDETDIEPTELYLLGGAQGQLSHCQAIIGQAQDVASATSGS